MLTEAEYQEKDPKFYFVRLIVAVLVTVIPTAVTFLGNMWRERAITSFDWKLVFITTLLQWALCIWLTNMRK